MPERYNVTHTGVVFGIVALVIGLGTVAPRPTAQTVVPSSRPSDALLAKLPADWRQPVVTLLTIPEPQQKQLIGQADDAVRQALARLLARIPRADDFLRTQLRADPSARVRTTIVQAIAAEARWLAQPGTLALLERVVAADADANVSLAALETLRRLRARQLNALLAERLAAANASRDPDAVARLSDEQERWISLERGTMLPAFLRTPPPPFSVAPADRTIRVLAFGDYGNGSAAQKALAQTIGSYHRQHPIDLGITLGDNFYTRGMESPSDPRWQTWWESMYGPLGITFYPTLGNHDWGQPDSPAAEILYASPTKSWRMPASYYTFTAGAVQFFALDTQSIAVADKQLRWLDDAIARSRATWKVVYGHHPIYSGGSYEERPDLVAKLLPLLRNRVDVYLCGHDHNLQALRPENGVHFYVAGGGGARLYELRPYERTVFASRANGFAIVEADAARLTVRLVGGSGTAVFEHTLTKRATEQ